MKELGKQLKPYRKECVLSPLFKMLEACFELLIPLVVASIIDTGIPAADTGHILKMCLLMVALGVIGLVCAVTAQFFAARAAVGYAAQLRKSLMEHILKFSYSQIDSLGTSTLVTRMSADINQIQNGVNLTLRLLMRSPFVVFGAMIMAFTIDAQAALVFAGVIPLLCIVVFGIMLLTMPMYKRVQAGLDRVTAAARQNLSGVRVLRAFRMEKQQTEQFADATADLTEKQLAAGKISALMNPVTFVIVNLAVVVLIYVGAVKVEGGVLSQGLVIALYNYMAQILVELIKMANLIITMTKAAASAKRVQAIFDTQSDDSRGRETFSLSGNVEFCDVSLVYNGSAEASLEHISFCAEPGQTIGVIGGTGSGKTSLVNLIGGFYPVSAGRVLIDGVDVRDISPHSLRAQIGIVPQKAALFRGTIRENLLWGRLDASDAELWQALETAQAAEVVRDKQGQLDAPVEQGAVNFSGGQKQRLTIARALVRKPKILILDDSASALDYATDAHLRRAIRDMADAPTTFIVSQRTASVRFADQILVLDDGRLVGTGTHGQLLETCEVYREIYRSQFSGEVVK